MKIISWNVNSMRTLKDNLKKMFDELEGDVVCLQETKLSRSTMEEDLAIIPNFSSYFNFARHQSGYSGVATFCRDSCRPTSAEEGLSGQFVSDPHKEDRVGASPNIIGLDSDEIYSLECEGRALLTRHDVKFDEVVKQLVVINVYCPHNDPDRPERAKYKLQFYHLLQQRAAALLQSGYHVIIAGDINTSHRPIDSCDCGDIEEFSSSPYRLWMDSFLLNLNDPDCSPDDERKASFADTFRYFHPQQKDAFTCWMTLTGARKTNYGTRIDYIFADVDLLPHLKNAAVMSDVEGSDHCPISVTIDCEPLPSKKCPSICAKYWPEFTGKQQSLNSFLRICSRNDQSESKCETKRAKKSQQKSIKNFFQPKNCARTAEGKVNCELESETEHCVGTSTAKVDGKSESEQDSSSGKGQNSVQASWKALLKGPPKPPKCPGHQEPCVLRVVQKEGPNYGRQFFVCCRAIGLSTNPEARCNFFKWATAPKIKMLSK